MNIISALRKEQSKLSREKSKLIKQAKRESAKVINEAKREASRLSLRAAKLGVAIKALGGKVEQAAKKAAKKLKPRKKHKLSAKGRAAIAAAQKKRWAKVTPPASK